MKRRSNCCYRLIWHPDLIDLLSGPPPAHPIPRFSLTAAASSFWALKNVRHTPQRRSGDRNSSLSRVGPARRKQNHEKLQYTSQHHHPSLSKRLLILYPPSSTRADLKHHGIDPTTHIVNRIIRTASPKQLDARTQTSHTALTRLGNAD